MRSSDMPRIVMPLFDFECEEITDYSFGDTGLSIQQLSNDDIIEIMLFSEQDIRLMRDDAGFALVFEKENIEGYKTLTNLMLMSFKIFCEIWYPRIKYRICKEQHSLCRRINTTMAYNYSFPRPQRPYRQQEIDVVNEGFHALIEMDSISPRTHNALYFLYRGFHSTKWMDAFILLMCSIESLFSKDKPGAATAAITTRVSSLLIDKPHCTKADIENLYHIRSRIIHGNISGPALNDNKNDQDANLENLDNLEYVVIECFKSLVEKQRYGHYSDKQSRDKFMGTLNLTD
jgi:hypothetical protein